MKDNLHRNKELVDKVNHRFNNTFYRCVMDRNHCVDRDDQPNGNNFHCSFQMERAFTRILARHRQDSLNRSVDLDDSEMRSMAILSQRAW